MAGFESLRKQKEVFASNRVFLIEYLDADEVSDELIQARLLSRNSAQQVQLLTLSREEKNKIIIDQLTTGGPGTLEKFCEILRNNKRLAFIVEEMEKCECLCSYVYIVLVACTVVLACNVILMLLAFCHVHSSTFLYMQVGSIYNCISHVD